ncbi:MAG: SufE family protein [Anaerolineae bacterium]
MAAIPDKLAELLADFATITDRTERAELLIETADRFPEVKVSPSVAVPPYDEVHRAPACESEAYVWADENPDGTVNYHFDVLNPQGLSAKAFAVIVGETLSGAPLEQIVAVSDDIVFQLFGKELSMGKGAGLMGILALVRFEAKLRLPAHK